jgi:outer membrane receptor for Fe3+-dicitrate
VRRIVLLLWMDTIRIVAQRVYSRDLRGFEARRKSGSGTFFDEAWLERRRPMSILDVLRQVPGVQVMRVGFQDRVIMTGGGFRGGCYPALFIDGFRVNDALTGDIDLLVSIREVGGVEAYRGGNVPAQFFNTTGCGTIVIWTRPPPPEVRRR